MWLLRTAPSHTLWRTLKKFLNCQFIFLRCFDIELTYCLFYFLDFLTNIDILVIYNVLFFLECQQDCFFYRGYLIYWGIWPLWEKVITRKGAHAIDTSHIFFFCFIVCFLSLLKGYWLKSNDIESIVSPSQLTTK